MKRTRAARVAALGACQVVIKIAVRSPCSAGFRPGLRLGSDATGRGHLLFSSGSRSGHTSQSVSAADTAYCRLAVKQACERIAGRRPPGGSMMAEARGMGVTTGPCSWESVNGL